ncbi:MAG TPA: tetraacyldisaccharide 4'-kinase [Pyrinomonadaceae bacterium]|jgi:tetraacyldisaccharide 4'-kinase|nr:tetraacyldisaccharide 4'-kinase [Pyrinomonadaceae bacterium]
MLSLLAWAYEKVVKLRNRLYDKGVFEVHDLGARTISIGNLTTGGTGKTPLVAYVADLLAERGEKVCILTRGYGRNDAHKRVLVSNGENVLVDASAGGDEPVELAQKLLGKAVIIADADRVAAAEWAKRKFGITAFVLDDGFQHRKAKRDVDIVCIDATDPFGGGKMLPAGRLREPAEGLKRANIVLITRADQIEDLAKLTAEILKLAPSADVLEGRNAITAIRGITSGSEINPAEVGKAFAFCGLGSPDNFFSLLRKNAIEVAGSLAFRDHYVYLQRDIERIEAAASEAGADSLVTTAKDAVKLAEHRFTLPCYVIEIGMEINDPARFVARITSF